MLDRPEAIERLEKAISRSPVTALIGPRQCGKTTLARVIASKQQAALFDLESTVDVQRLQNPELMLGRLTGLIVLDEIQLLPSLFNVIRVLVDRPENAARFLILGSASPGVVKRVSETLAGRVEFVELSGFTLQEAGPDTQERLWLRGGFPRSFLSDTDEDSAAWREGFIRTFLEQDIPQLGISVPAPAMRRFWTMLAHYHGQTWNASDISRSMGLSDKTVRGYLDILTGTFMLRQLQPWHENVGKRQVKSPKVFLRDSGLLHSLLNLPDVHALFGHPKVGASWEGFALEQVVMAVKPSEVFFWATHAGAGVDLFFFHRGRRYAVAFKFNEAPRVTRSMRHALADLGLDHLWVVYPGAHAYPVEDRITVWPLSSVFEFARRINSLI